MRLIDADAFREWWLENGENECVYDTNAFLDSIDNWPTLTLPNEWVSVKDAMPPEHEPVLCTVNGKPRSNIELEEAYQVGSWNSADGWIIDEWPGWENANVLWWMPLPEPPEGENAGCLR